VGGRWFVLPSVGLELQAGWRDAKISASVAQGSTGGSSPDVDFGGPFAKAGLTFLWGLRNPWGESAPPEAPAPPPSSELPGHP
jgi:hypothetical protein